MIKNAKMKHMQIIPAVQIYIGYCKGGILSEYGDLKEIANDKYN